MPFPFILPTTSALPLHQSFTSPTHPSLPHTATQTRTILRQSLKAHKRLTPTQQSSNLPTLLANLTTYLSYLNTLNAALSNKPVAGEHIDVTLTSEISVEWRPTLSSTTIPGREAERVKGQGLDYELFFVSHTYGLLQVLFARQALLRLYSVSGMSQDDRTGLIQTALRHFKAAFETHSYLVNLANKEPTAFPAAAVDISATTQRALQSLASAEFNLLSALKDDPYPALLAQARDKQDREWMIKAPTIPKTRAQVLTRLCVGAADFAGAAGQLLRTGESDGKKGRVDRVLLEYVDDLRATARARACRFQAVDCEGKGEVGKALGWVCNGLAECGVERGGGKDGEGAKVSGFGKFKAKIDERREDKRMEKGDKRWGMDAGKAEEVRILEWLEGKFNKQNDTVSFQKVPDVAARKGLLATLPSAMTMPIGDGKWKPVVLDEAELATMRAPPEDVQGGDESSGDEEGVVQGQGPAGAFPGTDSDYGSGYY